MRDHHDPEDCAACEGTGERYSVEKDPDGSHWIECEECDGYGIACSLESRRPYVALLAEAERIGWPAHFKRDLTLWDRTALEGRDPSLPFAWMVRESGTAICLPEDEHARTWNIAEHAKGVLGKHRIFWWNGSSLAEVTGEEGEERFKMEIAKYERRAAPALAAQAAWDAHCGRRVA